MRRRKRDVEIFNMSFLDVISCGFGAVILLLVVALAFEPTIVERISADLRGLIGRSEETRRTVVAESRELGRELAEKKKALSQLMARLDGLNASLEETVERRGAAELSAQQRGAAERQLRTVRQSLSEEMKRLLSQPDYRPPPDDATIGGIPVDSEYVIFVIDTSGSMKKGAWPLVTEKIRQILDSYPKLKGLQVMNDMGSYMFPTFAGQWIADTPARRALVLERLRSWDSFSNSSPVEGIVEALGRYAATGRPTSIYVFGDDFNGRSIESVIETVTRLNRRTATGKPQMRIHTFGFPVLPLMPVMALMSGRTDNFIRFAHLMRLLAEQNEGTFVGLNSLQ